MAKNSVRTKLQDYHLRSRNLFNSIILVLPLFVFYQLGVLYTGSIRNGVDFMSDLLWWITQGNLAHYMLINASVLLALLLILFALRKTGRFSIRLWPYVIVESSVYAVFLGGAVIQLMLAMGLGALLAAGSGELMALSWFEALVLSVGAGLYEEFVFRLILLNGLLAIAIKWLRMPRWFAAMGAVIVSSLIFSAIHHVGALGEAFVLGTFLFRFFAGILLAAIFYLRGFAVAVYTHALYDVLVMVLR